MVAIFDFRLTLKGPPKGNTTNLAYTYFFSFRKEVF